jgi:hypothetical protein
MALSSSPATGNSSGLRRDFKARYTFVRRHRYRIRQRDVTMTITHHYMGVKVPTARRLAELSLYFNLFITLIKLVAYLQTSPNYI